MHRHRRLDDGHVLDAGAHCHADRFDDRHGISGARPRAGRQHRSKRLVHARLQHRGLKVGTPRCGVRSSQRDDPTTASRLIQNQAGTGNRSGPYFFPLSYTATNSTSCRRICGRSIEKFAVYSVSLYRELDCGWVQSGGIRLACTPERRAGGQSPGRLGAHVRPAARVDLRAAEAQELFPLMRHRGVRCGLLSADRRLPRPVVADDALVDGARARAACRVFTHTRVTGIEVQRRSRTRRRRPSGATSRPRSWSTPAGCSRPRSAAWRGFSTGGPVRPRVPRNTAVP